MSVFSAGKFAISICQRCGMTANYQEMVEDGNIKGLYVHRDGDCYDQIDPYKLPPAPPDAFVLHHPRPDATLTPPSYVLNQDGEIVYGSDGEPLLNN